MPNTIKTRWSNVAGNTPATLLDGELAINTADGVLFVGDTNTVLSYPLGVGGNTTTPTTTVIKPSYALLRDVRPIGEDGGTARKETWNVRDVNEITYDSDNVVSLVGDDFVLVAGTYKITISCPAKDVKLHKVRLFNEITNVTEFEGCAVKSDDTCLATAIGVVQTDGTGIYEIQHFTEDKEEEEGLGEASKIGDVEVYTTVEIEKIG